MRLVALLTALLAFIGRSIGKILNTVFGWATIMLFGKVPAKRQILLSFLSLGALVWLLFVVGILLPRVGTFLLAFAIPSTLAGQAWVRVAMIAGALILPAVMGVMSLFVLDPEYRPKTFGARLARVARGYLFTPVLAFTLLLLLLFAPLIRLRAVLKRWSSQHVPMVVEPKEYAGVVEEIQRALAGAGFVTVQQPASWMIRFPTWLLATVARGSFERLVAGDLKTLRGTDLEVTLHPSDLLLRGKTGRVYSARVTVAQQLAFANVFLTWDKEAQEVELRLRRIWDQMRHQDAGGPRAIALRLETIDVELRQRPLPYEEWEVLYRKKLLVERGLLQLVTGIAQKPKEPKDGWDFTNSTTLLREALVSSRLMPRIATLGWKGLQRWMVRRAGSVLR